MFRGMPRVVRHLVAMPTLVAVAAMATICAPSAWVAGRRVRQGRRIDSVARWAD